MCSNTPDVAELEKKFVLKECMSHNVCESCPLYVLDELDHQVECIVDPGYGYDFEYGNPPVIKESVTRDQLDRAVKLIKAQQTVNQWIPCSDRLPKQQETVLIQDFDNITIGYLNGENRWRDLTNLDDYLKGVIAWMPLPEPYKEDDNGR